MKFILVALFLQLIINIYGFCQQTPKSIQHTYDQPIGYLEYLPPNYGDESAAKFPLLIHLHGGGEEGDGSPGNLERVKSWGPPSHIENGHDMCFIVEGKKECFVVLSPQLSPRYVWSYVVSVIIDHVLNGPDGYKVDHERIYLAGLSRGGYGTYEYASGLRNKPNKLAAIAPIAAWTDDFFNGCAIAERKIAVWAFHGKKDTIVPFGYGYKSFTDIRYCSYPEPVVDVLFTEYEERYHDAWIPAYDPTHNYHNPNLYEWFLMQRKAEHPITSVSSGNIEDVFTIFPNPSRNEVMLTTSHKSFFSGDINILGINGELVMTVSRHDQPVQINHLPSGVYIVQVVSDSGQILRDRFVKLD